MNDDMWKDALQAVIQTRKASTSLLQRRLMIGYSRSVRLIEEMEEYGIIGKADGSRPREVLVGSLDEALRLSSSYDSGTDRKKTINSPLTIEVTKPWKLPSIELLAKTKIDNQVSLYDLVSITKKTNVVPNLNIAVGFDAKEKPQYVDLAIESNLLIVGVPSSGKSSLVHSILTSLILTNSPTDLKLIIVDTGGLELTAYEKIPYLLTPVISNVEKAISALKWAVAEVERRITVIKAAQKRNSQEYNAANTKDSMPEVVIVIDGLPQLISYAFRDIESLVLRLAQRGRVTGIRLILTTYNITTEILNKELLSLVPSIVSFKLMSETNSRSVLGMGGAEKLSKGGDMMLRTKTMSQPILVHGAFVKIDEINKVTNYIREQGKPQFDDNITSQPVQLGH